MEHGLLPTILLTSMVAAAGAEELPVIQPYREEVEVRLVPVPVTVFDRKRRPVVDLERQDFELLVDGVPVPVETFDPPAPPGGPAPETLAPRPAGAPGVAPPPPPEATSPPVVTRAHVAIVLDLYMTSRRGVVRGFGALRKFLDAELPPATDVALLYVSRAGIQLAVPFTRDRAALRESLEKLYRESWRVDDWLRGEGEREGHVAISPPVMWCGVIQNASDEQEVRVRKVLLALRATAVAMAGLPGQKSVVLLSEGVRTIAGANYAYVLNASGYGEGYALARCAVNLSVAFTEVTRAFKAANVTLTPINLLGLYHPRVGDVGARDELLASAQFLAEETGGRRPIASNDFTGELSAAAEQPMRAYILTFRPPPAAQPGAVHRIEVRVRRKGLEVAARREYVEPKAVLTDPARFDAALLLPRQFRDLSVEPLIRVFPAIGTKARLFVQVELLTTSVAWMPADDSGYKGALEMHGVLRDASERVEELFGSRYAITLHADSPPSRFLLQELVETNLEGPAELVVTVQDATSGHMGASTVKLRPLASGTAEAVVSDPLLLAPALNVKVLSPEDRPLLSARLEASTYLPVTSQGARAEPRLAMVKARNLPANASVQFCWGEIAERCEPGRLDVESEGTPTTPSFCSAWGAIPGDAAASDSLRIKIGEAGLTPAPIVRPAH